MHSLNIQQVSACHQEAVLAIQILPAQARDVGEVISTQHEREKAVNREMFRVILQNLRFLVRQVHIEVVMLRLKATSLSC